MVCRGTDTLLGCVAPLELWEPLRGLQPCHASKAYADRGGIEKSYETISVLQPSPLGPAPQKCTFWAFPRPLLALKSWCLTAAPISNFLPAFYFGICLSMTLILAALLSSAAMVRESQCLTAMVRIGRDWLGGAFCNLGLIPLKCGAGGCFALCPGARMAGEGRPVAPPCAARGHFCKRDDLAELFQLRIASFCALFLLPGCCVRSFQSRAKGRCLSPKAIAVMTMPSVIYFFFLTKSARGLCGETLAVQF